MQILQKDEKFLKFIIFFGLAHYTIPRHIYHSGNSYVVSDVQHKRNTCTDNNQEKYFRLNKMLSLVSKKHKVKTVKLLQQSKNIFNMTDMYFVLSD